MSFRTLNHFIKKAERKRKREEEKKKAKEKKEEKVNETNS